ncbi:Stf0 family sulphotransferase [Kineococcus sp. NUM-3379]
MSPGIRPYLVCASQRSGSTLVCETLRATGVAGNPLEHFQYLRRSGYAPQPRDWFADVSDPAILELLAPLEPDAPRAETPAQWRERVLAEGRTPNGAWGGKLMWNQVPELLGHLDGLPGRSGTDLRSAVLDLLGEDPVYVHVYRPDVVPQAVSMWRAVQTQQWRGEGDPSVDDGARYHAGGIRHLEEILLEQERGWRDWFTTQGIEPLEISYEHLSKDPQGQVTAVLRAVGIDDVEAPPPPLRRQGNSRSAEWVERYRAERAS